MADWIRLTLRDGASTPLHVRAEAVVAFHQLFRTGISDPGTKIYVSGMLEAGSDTGRSFFSVVETPEQICELLG